MEQSNEQRHISNDDDDDFTWRGCSMKEIYRGWNEFKLKHVPPIHFSENHTVLYHFPIKDNNFPPRPLKGKWDKWDNSHVRLPCSIKSQYPVTKDDGTVSIESRWELIQTALLQPIRSSQDLENAILSYNSKYKSVWKFNSLHTIFNEELTEEDGVIFFDTILPKIINLALRLPELVSTAIPLLKQGENHSISLSQEQISCLLANAFLCTFPRRNTLKKKSEYSTFPNINFNRLYQATGQSVVEKIKCILHYFRRVCSNTPTGVVTFSRRFVPVAELPSWSDRDDPLGVTPLHISSTGTIEEQGQGLLQVDFANKFLGGGVLGNGCVQEEIRFVICPELIISKLFTEALKPFEALVIVGCEQYSKYSGYASSFTWDGDYKDITPFDDSSRRQCHIVAIDALHFVQSSHQYREELMLRELNKAYVGFYHTLNTPAPGVASGNWGCGAFGGESTLKALLQLMACTVTKRPLVYFTFGDIELRNAIHAMHTYFIENNITVRQLWKYLKQFRSQNLSPNDLYSFICQKHQDSHSILQCCTSSRGMLPNRHSPKKFTEEKIPKKPAKEEIQKNHIEENRNDTQNSKTVNENALSLNESSFAKVKKTTSSERNLNISRDIFASTSSSDEEKSSTKCDMFDLNTNRSYNIETSSTIKGNKSSELDSKDKSPRNKSEPRQRSLLEMLDVLYKDSPAKRHRRANENL